MPCSRTGYSLAMSILIYKCFILIYLSLLSRELLTSSFTIPKCVMSTKHGIFLFFSVVSSISFFNFCLFSCNSFFYHPTLAYSLTMPFGILAFIFQIHINFLIPIQDRNHPDHQLYLLIICDDNVESQFVGAFDFA